MAIDTKSLTQVITEFRALQSKDAVSPDSLGYILQRIADLLATAGTSETIDNILKLLDDFKKAGRAMINIFQGSDDPNNILANILTVGLGDGLVRQQVNTLFIKQATTERAGAMRAQQVIDLNNTLNNVKDIQTSLVTINDRLGITAGSKTPYNRAQISVCPVNNVLMIFGVRELLSEGYVPYLFRHTRKRNQWNDKKIISAGGTQKKYCSVRKGWNLYGSVHTLQINGVTLSFSTNSKSELSKPATSYSPAPETLVAMHTGKDGKPYLGWGRSRVCMQDHKNVANHRMIRLRFAIGFAKKIMPGRSLITTANLVSSLAEFSLIYDPVSMKWKFGR